MAAVSNSSYEHYAEKHLLPFMAGAEIGLDAFNAQKKRGLVGDPILRVDAQRLANTKAHEILQGATLPYEEASALLVGATATVHALFNFETEGQRV
jgi:hypothetical protein